MALASAQVTFKIEAPWTLTAEGVSQQGRLALMLEAVAAQFALTSGSGDGKVNWGFYNDVSLGSGATEVIDFYDFAGALDLDGAAFANSHLKAFALLLDKGDFKVNVSPSSSGGFTTGFLADASDILRVESGTDHAGLFVIVNPIGWAITDSTDHKIDVIENATKATTFSFLALGE